VAGVSLGKHCCPYGASMVVVAPPRSASCLAGVGIVQVRYLRIYSADKVRVLPNNDG
jgi:hypothetical protein